MTRLDALELIKKYYEEPVFNVKIGICSPQVTNVDFEEALEEFDRCAKFRNLELLEYVYIYCTNYVEDAQKLNSALKLFNLGRPKWD